MYKLILAGIAVSLPLIAASLPAAAAVTPNHVWSELGNVSAPSRTVIPQSAFGAAIRGAEAGGYLAVLTQAQTNRLERACDVAIRGGYSADTVNFCHLLKDEIDAVENDDSSSN